MAQFSSDKVIATLKSVLSAAGLSGAVTGHLDINNDHDGLDLVLASEGPNAQVTHVVLPDRLLNWLLDLRLLRGVPIAYLVPDPALLPVESIRFFHVDRNWTDRVVDGALSAGDIGTVDMTFTVATLTKIRELLDQTLGLGPTTAMTGMLIRSELVERWPDLIVEALPAQVAVLRQDTLSESIMLVLFAGVPDEVRVREPDVGLRFGIEPKENATGYEVNAYQSDGKPVSATAKIDIRLLVQRAIDIANLKQKLQSTMVPGDTSRAREIAINLRQQPYCERFRSIVDINRGSLRPDGTTKVNLRKGRSVNVGAVNARHGRTIQGGK